MLEMQGYEAEAWPYRWYLIQVDKIKLYSQIRSLSDKVF